VKGKYDGIISKLGSFIDTDAPVYNDKTHHLSRVNKRLPQAHSYWANVEKHSFNFFHDLT
jgi:hypothetical protein